MSDVDCPYCQEGQDINHDDGYGYDEGVAFQQTCRNCDKTFIYTTSISFFYTTEQADCLNGAMHNYEPTHTFPREYTEMQCSMCEETRPMTPQEKEEFISKNKGYRNDDNRETLGKTYIYDYISPTPDHD